MKHVLEELVPLEKIFLIKSSPIALSTTNARAVKNKYKTGAVYNLPEHQYNSEDQSITVNSKPFYTQRYHVSELSITETERLNTILPPSKYYLNVATINPQSQMHMFITQYPVLKTFFSDNDDTLSYPMYVPDELSASLKLNIHESFIQRISQKTGLTFIPEKVHGGHVCMTESTGLRPEFRISFSPIHLIDYIYATAHSNQSISLHDKAQPIQLMIPVPEDSDIFWAYTETGTILRELHLLQTSLLASHDVQLMNKSGNRVNHPIASEEIRWEANTGNTGRVWINTDHYFNNISRALWDFNIGNYYPLRKWPNLPTHNRIKGKEVHLYISVVSSIKHTLEIFQKMDV